MYTDGPRKGFRSLTQVWPSKVFYHQMEGILISAMRSQGDLENKKEKFYGREHTEQSVLKL